MIDTIQELIALLRAALEKQGRVRPTNSAHMIVPREPEDPLSTKP